MPRSWFIFLVLLFHDVFLLPLDERNAYYQAKFQIFTGQLVYYHKADALIIIQVHGNLKIEWWPCYDASL